MNSFCEKEVFVFIESMKKLLMKTRNKYVRRAAISIIEKYGIVEHIDAGCEKHLRSCKC